MHGPPSPRLIAPLADRIGDDADAARIAEAIALFWCDVDRDLSPIVGRRGVTALFERSLQLTAAAHPGLAAWRAGHELPADPSALKALVAGQADADAVLLGNAFGHAFRELLASLIGPSLSERLLRAAWGPPTSDLSAEEPT